MTTARSLEDRGRDGEHLQLDGGEQHAVDFRGQLTRRAPAMREVWTIDSLRTTARSATGTVTVAGQTVEVEQKDEVTRVYLMSMSSMSNTSMPCGLSGWPS